MGEEARKISLVGNGEKRKEGGRNEHRGSFRTLLWRRRSTRGAELLNLPLEVSVRHKWSPQRACQERNAGQRDETISSRFFGRDTHQTETASRAWPCQYPDSLTRLRYTENTKRSKSGLRRQEQEEEKKKSKLTRKNLLLPEERSSILPSVGEIEKDSTRKFISERKACMRLKKMITHGTANCLSGEESLMIFLSKGMIPAEAASSCRDLLSQQSL